MERYTLRPPLISTNIPEGYSEFQVEIVHSGDCEEESFAASVLLTSEGFFMVNGQRADISRVSYFDYRDIDVVEIPGGYLFDYSFMYLLTARRADGDVTSLKFVYKNMEIDII
jgi:hypothetical protein